MLAGNRLSQKVRPAAALFHAGGNSVRASILYMLVRGPVDLGTMIRRLRVSPSLASHHLKVLSYAGWVTRSKFGKLVTYYLNEETVKNVVAFLKKS